MCVHGPYRVAAVSDLPQTSLSQIEHLLQTAEAIRRDGKPEVGRSSAGLLHAVV